MSNLYVYLMRSRNKDNKDIPNFKERAKTILEYRENEDKVIDAFKSLQLKEFLASRRDYIDQLIQGMKRKSEKNLLSVC